MEATRDNTQYRHPDADLRIDLVLRRIVDWRECFTSHETVPTGYKNMMAYWDRLPPWQGGELEEALEQAEAEEKNETHSQQDQVQDGVERHFIGSNIGSEKSLDSMEVGGQLLQDIIGHLPKDKQKAIKEIMVAGHNIAKEGQDSDPSDPEASSSGLERAQGPTEGKNEAPKATGATNDGAPDLEATDYDALKIPQRPLGFVPTVKDKDAKK